MKSVRITPYDPAWPRRYEEEVPKVVAALGDLVVAVEHVGSTAIAGLDAKPTIDILVGADSIGDVDKEAKDRMAGLGYEFRGEMGVPGRCYFRKGTGFPREFNVHVVEFEGCLWRSNLAFRDYLREHPETANAYGDLKRELISSPGGAELDRYAAGKAGFIEDTVRRATRGERHP